MSDIDFASLLCSRLCHDLVSPVGSIYNGVELLVDEDDPEMRAKCLDLLADSAKQTANKLKFFRIAFGAAGGFGAQIDTREARTALEGLVGDRRVTLGWLVEAPSLPKNAMKVLLNLAMTAGDALLRGGRLNVAAEQRDGRIELAVRAEGDRILLDPELKAALEGRTAFADLAPRAAAAFLVHTLVREAGATLLVSEQEGALIFGVTLADGPAL
jgi:histidine phosphotransferase ChpT